MGSLHCKRRFSAQSEVELGRRMNYRHRAALAVLGWYLIAPPVESDKQTPPGLLLDSDAPFAGGT